MRRLKRFFSRVPKYILWLLGAFFFWQFVFNIITDAPEEKKVCLYADVPQINETALAVKLEEYMPEGIRQVQVRPFSYFMWDQNAILEADLYIIRASDAEEYLESFAPVKDAFAGAENIWTCDGTAFGITVYSPETGECAAGEYITYVSGDTADEECILFINSASLHAKSITGTGLDDAALDAALALINLN